MGGGTRIASDIVPWVSGVDVQQALLYCALGEEFPDIPEVPMKRCALLEFLDAPPGRLVAVEGLETVAAMHGVCEVKINCAIGATIPSVASDTSRPGYFILQTETEAELDALRARVLSTFRLVVEESR